MGFSTVDYFVLLLYLAGITVFGMRFRKAQRSVRDYFVGARNTSWIVICLSIVATETSTLTLIGVPALAYGTFARPEQGGTLTYLQVLIGYVVGRFIIARLFLPSYFRGDLLTAYALLERRFGAATRHIAASLFLLMRALAEGVRVFAASLVLSAVLASSFPNIPHLWLWSIALVGVLTLIYTFEGAIAAAIWTYLTQFVLFLGIGIMLFAYYRSVPAPAMTTNDEIFPRFIVTTLPHGISGLVIAAIFAAAMSNLSGSLNSLASTTVIDFYQPLRGGRVPDRRLLALSRWSTAASGVGLIRIA